ncbi:MAG TPA: hypothetical protein VMT24_16190 [Aggregatilineaceae bacterium]|nr:hypothetical protein [Aggregatilineaceae bacterium]
MQKWEYLYAWVAHQKVTMVDGKEVVKIKVGSDLEEKSQGLHEFLSQVGENGWELVSHKVPNIGTEIFVFKRPKPA